MTSRASAGLDMLIVQPTSLCNLNCRYCYVPDRLNNQRLPLPLLAKLLETLRRSDLVAGQHAIDILWHAGEPLAAGFPYFTDALNLADEILAPRWQVRHTLQTNGTLIDDAWCRLFRERDITVGVSIDGPETIHDANRKNVGGRGSFAHAMRGVNLLRKHGIPLNILSVLTSTNIASPDAMFHFFVEQQFPHVAFNIEEIEGPNLHSSLVSIEKNFAGARSLYRSFMTRMLELNRSHGWPLIIREFRTIAQMIQDLRQFSGSVPDVPEQRAGAVFTMTRDGKMFSWSPELASGVPGDPDRFSLGNIADVLSLDELLQTEKAQSIQREIDCGVNLCRGQCQYFSLCGGGVPGNKFFERGSFAVTETLKCALQTQELVEIVLSMQSKPAPAGAA
jgi:uncharacterized protein